MLDPSRTTHFAGPDRSRLHPGAVPTEVLDSIHSIRSAGGQVYLVGGAVRDLLLGREIRDWDIATDLLPEQIVEIFPRTHQVGAHFGTVLVMAGGTAFEITTFRSDGVYVDARHPESVEYSDRIEVDLTRRDFTVNALAYDPESDRLVDPHGGISDLTRRVLRTVGDPIERFQEDALRLLRAVRLSAQLDLDLEPATYRALVLCAPGIERISAERIRDELDKLLAIECPSAGLDLFLETGLLRRFLPELADCYGVAQNPHHAYDVYHHSLASVDRSPPDNRPVRLAALFHDLGKPETRVQREETASFYSHQTRSEHLVHRLMRRLRYSNRIRERVGHLVRHHMFHYTEEWSQAAVRRFLRNVGAKNVDDLFSMRAADTFGNGLRTRIAPELDALRERIEAVLEYQNALHIRDLAINGTDLMRHLGLGPGPALGRILEALLTEVIEDPERNERESLLALAATLIETEPDPQERPTRSGEPAQSDGPTQSDDVSPGPKKSSGPKGNASSL